MKETLKIQYFVDFFSKQTNKPNIFSYFNYCQLGMVFFFFFLYKKRKNNYEVFKILLCAFNRE